MKWITAGMINEAGMKCNPMKERQSEFWLKAEVKWWAISDTFEW